MALPKALESVINNPLVKAALFKQLVKIMQDNKIHLVTLSLDADNKLKIDAFNEPTKVLPKKDFDTILLKTLNNGNSND